MEGAELSLLPCLHVFHKACIHKWCNRHIVCPLCKRHLEAAEPLHTLTAAYNHHHGAAVQSEPGGNRGYANGNNGAPRNPWRGMLGAAALGPLSAHGSERGLGGTRSEDGMWNDRVLNAAQQQLGGRHHRVTSFSSETRRANSARGRTGERGGPGGGRGGPPHSSSTGASKGGPQRSQSVSASGWGGQGQHHGQNHRLQRKRSSSFTTASERGRGGSGRVAHGTAPHRGGGGGGLARSDFSTSPRARSDLGVGSREADHMPAASDAMLSRHASRRNNGAGGTKALPSKPMFGDDFGDGEGWGGSGDGSGRGAAEYKEESKRRTAVVTVSSNRRAASQQGVRSKAQGPAVITVRKGNVGGAKATAAPGAAGTAGGGGGSGRRTQRDSNGSGGPRDTARSGGESESDFGGERVFTTNHTARDDDSPDEVTTKALTYGPRKSKVKSSSKNGPGHRRQSSTGSTSAEEFGGSGGGSKKSRRRPSIPGSKSGSGNQNVIASAAATAEAVSKLLSRTPQDERSTSKNTRRRSGSGAGSGGGGGGGGGHSRRSSFTSEGYSDYDSGSDARPGPAARRGSGGGGSGRAGSTSSLRSNSGLRNSQQQNQPQNHQQQQQQHHQQQVKTTPTKTGPVTKGTPAPPMAAARVATWNSNASGLAPALDVSQVLSTSETEVGGASGAAATTSARGAEGGGVGSSPSGDKDKGPGSGGRGWNLRIPSSAGSSEFFGVGSASGGGGGTRNNSNNTGSSVASADGAPADGESDREGGGGGNGSGSLSARTSSLASRVFSRSAGSGKVGSTAARMFGSNHAAARIGVAPGGGAGAGDSAEEGAAPGSINMVRSSSSVQVGWFWVLSVLSMWSLFLVFFSRPVPGPHERTPLSAGSIAR